MAAITILFFISPVLIVNNLNIKFEMKYFSFSYIAFIPGFLSYHFYFKYFRFWLEQTKVENKFILGEFIQKAENGDCITHQKSAKCSFKNCSGIVYLDYAPPREQGNNNIIGKCNKNKKIHTYTFEYDGYGNYQKMNFDPIEKVKNQHNY